MCVGVGQPALHAVALVKMPGTRIVCIANVEYWGKSDWHGTARLQVSVLASAPKRHLSRLCVFSRKEERRATPLTLDATLPDNPKAPQGLLLLLLLLCLFMHVTRARRSSRKSPSKSLNTIGLAARNRHRHRYLSQECSRLFQTSQDHQTQPPLFSRTQTSKLSPQTSQQKPNPAPAKDKGLTRYRC